MKSHTIHKISSDDARYVLPAGAGSDAVHTAPEYCMAVTRLGSDRGLSGTGIALTLGNGNRLVCEAIEMLAQPLAGLEIEDLMADFGTMARRLADNPSLRWLGPHKGVVHLALASITNACFDLWAKSRGVPLWKLLLDLTPEAVVRLLDLSYIEDEMSSQEALLLLNNQAATRSEREHILASGYPGYDTSVGWIAYEDDKVRELTLRSINEGFTAFKLKVGSSDAERDYRRAAMLRESIGDAGTLMLDANQAWNLPVALQRCRELAKVMPMWIEEPTHPDDIHSHAVLAETISPVKIAAGEHIPNRVLFKNFMQSCAVYYVQADCTRLAGVSEFLAVSLMAKKFRLPVVPHVGDMGQIHQHLVLFNHIAIGHDALLLEHIPHLHSHFVFPVQVGGGVYKTPQDPGASCDLKSVSGGKTK